MRNILLLFMVTIIGLSSCSGENTKMIVGNTSGNINNYGVVATESDWVYFWNGTTQSWGDLKGGKFCKMKLDGSNFQVISNDNPCYINVIGEWIYFIKQPRPANYMGEIYRIRKDGSNRKELYKGKSSVMTVIGDWIYFLNLSDGNRIYKIKTNGSELTKLIDFKSYDLQYENEYFYFMTGNPPSNFTLNKFNIFDLNKTKAIEKVDSINIYNGWIYGSNANDGIFKIKNDGTAFGKIFNQKISSFNVSDNYVYCSGVSPDQLIKGKGISCYFYKISLDGTKVFTLPNENGIYRDSIVGIVGDHIYYWVNCGEWLELARMKNDGTGDEILINRLKVNK